MFYIDCFEVCLDLNLGKPKWLLFLKKLFNAESKSLTDCCNAQASTSFKKSYVSLSGTRFAERSFFEESVVFVRKIVCNSLVFDYKQIYNNQRSC